MQALTGLFARQFGTPNYAAHGGFCSVNMAAGMIYSVGGSFWEFGGRPGSRQAVRDDRHRGRPPQQPDEDRLGDFKRKGAASSRSTLCAPAIRRSPTSGFRSARHRRRTVHGAAARNCSRKAWSTGRFLQRFTNAPQLVVLDEGEREGLFAFDPAAAGPPGDGRHPHNKLAWDPASGRVAQAYPEGVEKGANWRWRATTSWRTGRVWRQPSSCCETALPTPRPSGQRTSLASRPSASASWRGKWGDGAAPGLRTSHSVDRCVGSGTPPPKGAAGGLPRHARAGGAFQRVPDGARAGGAHERAGHHRRARRLPPQGAVPAPHRAELPGLQRPVHDQAQHAAERGAVGFPAGPDELAVHEDGTPLRIDHAFSWEHPLSAHGMMHNVITNAVRGDPYEIDTLLIFMANMA